MDATQTGAPRFDDATVEENREPTDLRAEPVWYGNHRACFELASGGMATVYLARTRGPAGFERLVALKRIHAHLMADERFATMFVDEARIAAQITHPSVCSVFDFGEANGSHYLAMQYLVGEPLWRVISAVHAASVEKRSDPRTAAYLVWLLAEACEGLHAAHELRTSDGEPRYVVHRDVSPQNLVVTYDGHISVVDFGIASATGRYQKTLTGRVRGKTAYMAPEQFRSASIDRRVDIWAMGVVLWEAITQQRLFRRDTPADTLIAILHDPVPPPSVVREGVPDGLDAIVARALSRSVEDRQQTARDLGRELLAATQPYGPIGAADIAEWMARLFPDGEARHRSLASLATGATVTLPPQPSAATGATRAVRATAAPAVPEKATVRHAGTGVRAAALVSAAAVGAVVAAVAMALVQHRSEQARGENARAIPSERSDEAGTNPARDNNQRSDASSTSVGLAAAPSPGVPPALAGGFEPGCSVSANAAPELRGS